jgi:Leucine-rich repeat (LRR) protein
MLKTRFVTVLFVIFIYKSTFAQTKVFIPDINFRNFLNTSYPTFMDISGDSLIADSAATLTGFLECSDKNIADLTGVEYFTNITGLWCHYNQLTSLPDLSAITDLSYLYCFNNQLTSLPDLSGNTALKDLRCQINQLTSLPDLSANTELSYLSCYYNQLTSLPDLSSNPVLTVLHCSNNQLTSLPDLSVNTELHTIECFENQLTSLPDLSNNTKLSFLSCSKNQLTSLPDLPANTALTGVLCSNNQLTSIPDLSESINLTTLDCSYNQITSLPDLSANTALTMLSASSNQLTNLPDLSANTALLELRCDDNLLTSLPDLTANTALTLIRCSGNQLTQLPDLAANIALTILACSNNQLTNLPDLSANTDLINLSCGNNKLTSLPDLSANINLSVLYCYHNQLTNLPDLSANKNLSEFNCSYNNLDFSDAKSLRTTDTLSNLTVFNYSPQNPFGSRDSINLCEGDTLILRIARQDSALSYQWFKDGSAISNATDTFYLFPNPTQSETGIYKCRSYGTALLSPPMNHGPGINEFISDSFIVSLNPKAEFTGLDTIYCLGDPSVNLTGIPPGGTFSGPGINNNIFTPGDAGEGTHTIVYSYEYLNNCVSADTQKVTVEICAGIISPEHIRSIKIYPNPGRGIFNITIEISQIEDIKLQIINSLGQPLHVEELKLAKGTYTGQFDLREYPAGVYYLQILSNKDIVNKNLIITEK